MKFAENNRISHRQLYRQLILSFLAPFLLCLFGNGGTLGKNGVGGTVVAVILLFFYVIFLMRLRHSLENPVKTAGWFVGCLTGIFFLIYCVLTAAFLLALLGEIVTVSLGTGVSKGWLLLFSVLLCSLGTSRGIQRRGRMAEVSGGLVLAAVVLMLVLSVRQGKWEYFQEMVTDSRWNMREILTDCYGVLCAFSGIGFLPFSLKYVEKNGSAGKTVRLAVGTLGILLILVELLLPAIFGWERLKYETIPIFPLLAGADLPGNVLARFDVLWMSFLLYSLLFSIGSLLHYGHLLTEKTGLGSGKGWICVAVYLLALFPVGDVGIQKYFRIYLGYIFVPGMLIFQAFFFFLGWKKRKKNGKAMGLVLVLLGAGMMGSLSGCGGVEPEKRLYPLAMGADMEGEKFLITLGTPDLPKATGQEKNGEDEEKKALEIKGKTFDEIEDNYRKTQEKYLDPGHLEILVFGKSVLEQEHWKKVLEFLQKNPTVGENVYVFQAENAEKTVGWSSPRQTSLGEYVSSLLENNPDEIPEEAVTLREVYYQMYESGKLPELPELKVDNENLEVVFDGV